MSISAIQTDERVKNVSFTEDTISADLIDGRTIVVPLAWYPRLLNATPAQRLGWEICGGFMVFTGIRSMKILVPLECSEAHLLQLLRVS